jgi:methanogenic corrinoid protein MtbC1
MNAPPSRVPDRGEWLTIGSLSRATGIPVPTLRTWERRYGFPVPVRRPSGHRLYRLSAVPHLRLLRRALAAGRRPVEIMGLPLPRLETLVAEAAMDRAGAYREPEGAGAERGRREAPAPAADEATVEGLLHAAASLELDDFVDRLRTTWARLGPLEFLERCAAPLARRIGDAWARGELGIRHEHLASVRLCEFLREARRPYDEAARGPFVALATPPGDLHEIGLLMAALVFALRGYRVLYLGPGTPAAEIARLVQEAPLRVVAVSVSETGRRAAGVMLRSLRRSLPRSVVLWTGGSGAPAAAAGIRRARDLRDLHVRLAGPG